MKPFSYREVSSADEAATAAKEGGWLCAGGTDLLGALKDEINANYPKTVINIKKIEGLDYITEDGDVIRIGALTSVQDVADSDVIKQQATALAEAAAVVSSPTLRVMGTIGGNVCQQHRCWYFRTPRNRFNCFRKGGDDCPAMLGDSRYHSIFGPEPGGCIAVNPQDTAPALVALGASIITTQREIPASEFFQATVSRSNILEDGEVVTELSVPKAAKSTYYKYALRKTIDFALVSCAVAETSEGTKVVLGGVYPSPWESEAAEQAIAQGITDASAQAAGDAAVESARPLVKNEYKVEIARTVVKRALLALNA